MINNKERYQQTEERMKENIGVKKFIQKEAILYLQEL